MFGAEYQMIANPSVFKIFDLAQMAVSETSGSQLVDLPDVR
jgi:hypothetical protein